MIDKRTGFFLGAAVLCYLMVPIADPKNRWVAIATGSVYVVLALLGWLDWRSRSKLEPAPRRPLDDAPATVDPESQVSSNRGR